jgi:hypothetical protein
MKIKSIRQIEPLEQVDITTRCGTFCATRSRVVVHNSPAVFAGQDPTDGKFFVAKKGIFNKSPKVYKSVADVRADTSGDLAEKLSVAFTELSKLGIKGVLQGDMMFTKNDLKLETIEGEKYVTFHPNTIVYAVPVDSDLGKQIRKAKMGIVFHTKYTGDSFETMRASYDADVSVLKKTQSVWFQDATLRDVSGKATMTKTETSQVVNQLSLAKATLKRINKSLLKTLSEDSKLAGLIETYGNTLVRKGEVFPESSADHFKGLITWLDAKHEKEIESKKSEMGKAGARKAKETSMSLFLDPDLSDSFKAIFDLQRILVQVKGTIIQKLNSLGALSTFIKTTEGFRVTPAEGFVAIDRIGKSGAVKLVDRLEFSRANFSPDVLKGWQK